MRPVATPSPYSSRDQEGNCDDGEDLQDGDPVIETEQRLERSWRTYDFRITDPLIGLVACVPADNDNRADTDSSPQPTP